MDIKIPDKVIHQIVNESQYPVVFKNILKNEKGENLWQLLNWDMNKLSQKIGKIKLPFREGVNSRTMEPQWEYKCPIRQLTLDDFLKMAQVEKNPKWYYFDYKYLHEWFKDNEEMMQSIDWKLLGYDIDSKDSTIWIGSKGAHTNCHKDTYGNNLVVQIHGRKRWTLYPPDVENFRETRDPYEESTVYTKLNLFTPSLEETNHIKTLKYRPRVVTLEPGDVLFVPHGWWHFVESLDTSLSVNYWFPLETDCFDRLSEALVKLIISRIGNDIPVASDNDKSDFSQSLNFVRQSLIECKEKQSIIKQNSMQEPSTSKSGSTLEDIFTNYSDFVKMVKELSEEDFEQFLDEKNSKFENKESNIDSVEECHSLESCQLKSDIVNAFCKTKIIQQIVEILSSNNIRRNA